MNGESKRWEFRFPKNGRGRRTKEDEEDWDMTLTVRGVKKMDKRPEFFRYRPLVGLRSKTSLYTYWHEVPG
jgi:hypothetical protein